MDKELQGSPLERKKIAALFMHFLPQKSTLLSIYSEV